MKHFLFQSFKHPFWFPLVRLFLIKTKVKFLMLIMIKLNAMIYDICNCYIYLDYYRLSPFKMMNMLMIQQVLVIYFIIIVGVLFLAHNFCVLVLNNSKKIYIYLYILLYVKIFDIYNFYKYLDYSRLNPFEIKSMHFILPLFIFLLVKQYLTIFVD